MLCIHKILPLMCSKIFLLEVGNSDAYSLHVFTVPSPHQFSLPVNYSNNAMWSSFMTEQDFLLWKNWDNLPPALIHLTQFSLISSCHYALFALCARNKRMHISTLERLDGFLLNLAWKLCHWRLPRSRILLFSTTVISVRRTHKLVNWERH
jgi:hypothetical protein